MFGDPEERLRVLADLAWNWKEVVRRTLKDNFERELFFKKPDNLTLYRLLSLRTWSMKYKLPLKEILKVLLSFWDSIAGRRRTKSYGSVKGLGCTIPCLCGDRSEELLQEYLEKKYPNRENEREWKAARREDYIRTRKLSIKFKNTLGPALQSYTDSVLSVREKNRIVESRMKKTKRRYPGNPWL